MTRLCFQYLANYSNENLPKSIQIVPKWVEKFAQNQIYCPKPNILPNIFKYLPKWWSFAKSGHTAYHRIANGFLKLGQPRPLFVLFKYNFAEKMFGIWTWIVRLEGEHPDHLTTTTAQGFYLGRTGCLQTVVSIFIFQQYFWSLQCKCNATRLWKIV